MACSRYLSNKEINTDVVIEMDCSTNTVADKANRTRLLTQIPLLSQSPKENQTAKLEQHFRGNIYPKLTQNIQVSSDKTQDHLVDIYLRFREHFPFSDSNHIPKDKSNIFMEVQNIIDFINEENFQILYENLKVKVKEKTFSGTGIQKKLKNIEEKYLETDLRELYKQKDNESLKRLKDDNYSRQLKVLKECVTDKDYAFFKQEVVLLKQMHHEIKEQYKLMIVGFDLLPYSFKSAYAKETHLFLKYTEFKRTQYSKPLHYIIQEQQELITREPSVDLTTAKKQAQLKCTEQEVKDFKNFLKNSKIQQSKEFQPECSSFIEIGYSSIQSVNFNRFGQKQIVFENISSTSLFINVVAQVCCITKQNEKYVKAKYLEFIKSYKTFELDRFYCHTNSKVIFEEVSKLTTYFMNKQQQHQQTHLQPHKQQQQQVNQNTVTTVQIHSLPISYQDEVTKYFNEHLKTTKR